MKKNWRRNISILVATICLLVAIPPTNVFASSYLDANASDISSSFDWIDEGIYPVIPGDGIWEQLSYIQQLAAISMPEDKLDSYTTEELAQWVLEYPFLIDVLAFSTAEQAMDYFMRTSNICREFFMREEANDILLKEYGRLTVDYEMLSGKGVYESEPVFLNSGYTKELFLQTYFADKLEQLTEQEKEELCSILEEKYIEKIGVCDNYSSALLFYGFVQDEYGYIPEDVVPDAIATSDLFEASAVKVEDVGASINALNGSGFTDNGYLVVANGGAVYKEGTYTLYGRTVYCLKYSGGDYLDLERAQEDAACDSAHTSWTRVFSASRKYNCHSYAWIEASQSNIYWMGDPDPFASSPSFSYISRNGNASSGDRIIIRSSIGSAEHSLITTFGGNDINTIKTTSKFGRAGVYDAPLVDMMIYYKGNYYEVYR